MRAAIRIELLKLRRSSVGIIGSALMVAGLLALVGGIMAALASGNPELAAKMGPTAVFDWSGLVGSAEQIMSAGGLVGFGVVLAWMFAREFSDGTITALFANPVGRGTMALAKLEVHAGWATMVSVLVAAGLVPVGLLLGFGWPDEHTWASLARFLVLGLLTMALAVPVAWVATVTRSLLAGVAAVVLLVVIAQVGVLVGAGAWMPLAAPALWALSDGADVSPQQLALPVAISAAFVALTARSWTRLQLDR